MTPGYRFEPVNPMRRPVGRHVLRVFDTIAMHAARKQPINFVKLCRIHSTVRIRRHLSKLVKAGWIYFDGSDLDGITIIGPYFRDNGNVVPVEVSTH